MGQGDEGSGKTDREGADRALVDASDPHTIRELRCHRQLVGKIRVGEDNVIEVPCPQCKKDLRVKLVLHRFNIAGEFLGTKVIPRNGSG